jgi:hypothetical protein
LWRPEVTLMRRLREGQRAFLQLQPEVARETAEERNRRGDQCEVRDERNDATDDTRQRIVLNELRDVVVRRKLIFAGQPWHERSVG